MGALAAPGGRRTTVAGVSAGSRRAAESGRGAARCAGMSRANPICPIRDNEPCTLCHPGADGPANCGLVYLVESDPDMREQWTEHLRAAAARRRADRLAKRHAGA